jgi:rod shape-determining protein MreC
VLDFDGTKKARRKDAFLALCVLVIAFAFLAVPPAYQRPVRDGYRKSILRPFLGAQTRLAIRRTRTEDLAIVRAQRDSLAALVVAEATLSEENAQLRGVIGMRERVGDKFIPAEVVRLGTGGAESSFIVNVGTAEGVREGSPIITPDGLLGVVLETDTHAAMAIDWSHAQFRASGMTADGSATGVIEPKRGRYREDDVIALSGTPFQTNIAPGKRVVTTGRGGIFPRGILVGTIMGIDESDTGWRKSYLVRPAVRPEQARHVLVGIGDATATDMSDYWNVTAPPDTASLPDTIPPKPAAPKKPATGRAGSRAGANGGNGANGTNAGRAGNTAAPPTNTGGMQ